jgi:hypothetical protein
VAIDARVQRRPPHALVKEEDAAVEQTAELVLNDSQVHRSSFVISLWAAGRREHVLVLPKC